MLIKYACNGVRQLELELNLMSVNKYEIKYYKVHTVSRYTISMQFVQVFV